MDNLQELRQELSRRGEAFAQATVVWRRAPSSAQPGNKAIVTAAGKVRGFLSGACSESVVVREARKAMESGQARLVLLGSPEELAARANDGIELVVMACQSEGAIELFIEPVLPTPHLVDEGRTPMVDTLVTLAGTLGWRTVVVDDQGDPEAHPQAGQVVTTLDFAAAGVGEGSLIVVATQGQYDELALDKALGTRAGYIGLIASRKRAAAVIDWLKDMDYTDEMLSKITAPAGLDLGSLKHEEIAVGVLAELVRYHAAHRPSFTAGASAHPPAELPVMEAAEADEHAGHEHRDHGGHEHHDHAGHEHHDHGEHAGAAGPVGPTEAVDPVCGMLVDTATARFTSVHDGATYYFCCPACKKKFEKDPAAYLAVTA